MEEQIKTDEIKETGSLKTGEIHCLTIIGQIEGHQTLGEDIKTERELCLCAFRSYGSSNTLRIDDFEGHWK